MRRSRVSRPHLKLTRTYTAEIARTYADEITRAYAGSFQFRMELSSFEIHGACVIAFARATNRFASDYAEVKCDLTNDGYLILEISATDSVPTTDHITTRSLEDAKRHADEAFKSFSQLIVQGFASALTRGTLAASVTTSMVEFSVGPQVAAATRDRQHLEFLTECSVIDYYEKAYRDHPRPDQYTITRGEGLSLRISAEQSTAEDVSAALLGEPRSPKPTRRSIDRWLPPSTPYWGASTLILAIYAVAIAAFRVTPIWLAATALGTVAAVGSALIMARRRGASVPKTALGMSPAAIVLGFAVYYGLLMTGDRPSITITSMRAPHLVDAFLLSLGMASTGGFFDLSVHTTPARVVAFAETLLTVSVAGGSMYIGARAAWDRLRDIARTDNNPQ